MIAVISPAKNMKCLCASHFPLQQPSFPEKTKKLASYLKEYSAWQLESALHINPKLAMEAFANFQDFQWEREGTPALLAYHGLQYRNIGTEDFTMEDFLFAEQHLRIVSAFYGLLHPLDRIQPYRLEMGSGIRMDGQTLYQFWGDALRSTLFQSGETVIDLASKEYGKAIWPNAKVSGHMITCEFQVIRHGKRKTLATLAKMARGQMIRQMIKERWEEPHQLQTFQWEGFCYDPMNSNEEVYRFIQNGG